MTAATGTVGIIANPAAGKDIRRLVAQGRVVSNQEKANTLRRVFAGLAAAGVERVLVMPDMSGLARPAMADRFEHMKSEYLDMLPAEQQDQSTAAARMMAEVGVGCIVTLGGDGTNRVVAKGCDDVPLVPISTGTNNVFPQMVEGTLAGLAAGAVATGAVDLHAVSRTCKRLDVFVDGRLADMALIDAAVSTEMFVGARAVWDMGTVREAFLTRAEPACIGISSVGAMIRPIGVDDEAGLRLRFATADEPAAATVRAPIAPGVVAEVRVAEWSVLVAGERHLIEQRPGTVALDGEREVTLLPRRTVEVALSPDGPRVVDVPLALRRLAQDGRRPI